MSLIYVRVWDNAGFVDVKPSMLEPIKDAIHDFLLTGRDELLELPVVDGATYWIRVSLITSMLAASEESEVRKREIEYTRRQEDKNFHREKGGWGEDE